MATTKRDEIIRLAKEGLSVQQIARRTGYDRRLVKRWHDRETSQDRPRSGRPPKLTVNVIRKVRGVMKV